MYESAGGREARGLDFVEFRVSDKATVADRVAWLALAVMAAVAAATFADYGIGNDEWNSDRYGKLSLLWYLSGGTDHSSFVYYDLRYYGAGIHALIAALERLWPADGFAVRHGVGMALGLIGLAGTWRLGRRLGGPWTGLAAPLILALTPYYWGQMAFLPVDTPFFAAMSWGLLAIIRYVEELPRPRLSSALWMGLVAGLAAGVRIGAAPIIGVEAVFALLLWTLARRPAFRPMLASLAWQIPLILVVALAAMFACWPWALRNPVDHIVETLGHFAKLPMDFVFPFWGMDVRTVALPWFYVPGYLLAKLPLLFLAGIIASPVAVALARGTRMKAGVEWPAFALAAFAAVFPVVVAVLTHATLYDGVRHFLFILAPLAALAGFALVWLARAIPYGRLAVGAVAALSAVLILRQDVLLHPYEYIWFNPLAGGVAGAQDRFEMEYWTTAESEMIRELRAKLRAEGTESRPYRYKLCVWWLDVSPLLPPDWQVTDGDNPTDFVFAPSRFACAPDGPGSIVRIVREGLTLGWVADLRKKP